MLGIEEFLANAKVEGKEWIKNYCADNRLFINDKNEEIIFITTLKKYRSRERNPVKRYYSSIVIDGVTLDPLCIGMRNSFIPNAKIVLKDTIRGKQDIKIYELIDGTLVTIYNHGGIIKIASSSGYDLSNFKWGPRTYTEILNELLAKYDIQLTPESFPQGTCWTFLFRHHSFHPVLADPEKIQLVQWCELGTDIKIHESPPVEGKFSQPFPFHFPIENANLKEMIDKCGNESISNAINKDNPQFFYGIKIRYNDGEDILFRSQLLCYLRRMVYNTLLGTKFVSIDRIKYSVISYTLAKNKDDQIFENLFPQFLENIENCKNFVDEVIYSMIAKLKKQSSSNNQAINKAAEDILEKYKNEIKEQTDVESMVRDFVYSLENNLIIYEAMFS